MHCKACLDFLLVFLFPYLAGQENTYIPYQNHHGVGHVVRAGGWWGRSRLQPVRNSSGLLKYLPGIALTSVASTLVWLLSRILTNISPLLIALLLGATLGNLISAWIRKNNHDNRKVLWDSYTPGRAFCARRVLRTGVALLGLRLALGDITALGWRGLTIVTVTLATTFLATYALGNTLGLDRNTSLLISTGYAICGASAISAMSGVIEDSQPRGTGTGSTNNSNISNDSTVADSAAIALTLITLFGSIAIFALPALSQAFNFTDAQAALWIGASVQEVAQVVAAAGAVSAATLALATVAKLARVALLAPLVAMVGLGLRTSAAHSTDEGSRKRTAPIPLFVAMFLVMVGIRSTGILPTRLLDIAAQATTVMFIAAMFALGLSIDLIKLAKAGGRSLLLGTFSAIIATGVSLAGVLLLT